MDEDISPFLPLDLMFVTYAILFIVCVTGKTFCLDNHVIPCLIHLAQGLRGLRLKLC